MPPPTQPSGGSALGGIDIVRNLSSFLTSKLKQEVVSRENDTKRFLGPSFIVRNFAIVLG